MNQNTPPKIGRGIQCEVNIFIFRLTRRLRIYAGRWTIKFDMEYPDGWLSFADQAGLFPKCEY
jgi:hypothetical protein